MRSTSAASLAVTGAREAGLMAAPAGGARIRHLQGSGCGVGIPGVSDARRFGARFGMSSRFGSCHTEVVVDGCALEVQVRAHEVGRRLHERPDALGASVPGMPVGPPGPDGPE